MGPIDLGVQRVRDRVNGLIATQIEKLEGDFAAARHHTTRAHASGGIAALRKLGELLAAPEQIAKDALDADPEELRKAGAI